MRHIRGEVSSQSVAMAILLDCSGDCSRNPLEPVALIRQ